MSAFDRMELLAEARKLIAARWVHGAMPMAQLSLEQAVDLVELLEKAGHQFAPHLEALYAAIGERMNEAAPTAAAQPAPFSGRPLSPEEQRQLARQVFAEHPRYIGVKAVAAWAEKRDGVDGYGVMYRDGYRSWCPKDTFEEANRPLAELLP